MQPIIYTRDQHCISRKHISNHALKVLYTLNEAGYRACLVGGGVRDLLLHKKPKDFDVATDATPEQIKRLFRNCRLIGKRFRLAHIIFGRDIIEVATFRGESADTIEPDDIADELIINEKENDGEQLRTSKKIDWHASKSRPRHTLPEQSDWKNKQIISDSGFILRDNVFGSIEEDALRRDFTINALYYDIANFTVIDFCNGMEDLKNGVVRLIGDPEKRYREDPVRMIRALRFAAKLNLKIDDATAHPIEKLGYLLQSIPGARMFDEIIKLLMTGYGEKTYHILRQYKVFGQLFPQTERSLIELEDPDDHLLIQALKSTDSRINDDLGVNPYFLYAALLWEPYLDELNNYLADKIPPLEAANNAARTVISRQQAHTQIPKRYSIPMEETWAFQMRLERKNTKTVGKLIAHPRFRAGLDFMLLRAKAFESDMIIDAAKWWTEMLNHPEHSKNVPPSSAVRRKYYQEKN